MEYKSVNQMAKEFKRRISDDITTKDIQNELRKLGYINRKNLPTAQAIPVLHYIESYDLRGRPYYKWEQTIIDEIGDTLYEKSWR